MTSLPAKIVLLYDFVEDMDGIGLFPFIIWFELIPTHRCRFIYFSFHLDCKLFLISLFDTHLHYEKYLVLLHISRFYFMHSWRSFWEVRCLRILLRLSLVVTVVFKKRIGVVDG
jgi:hypothetical protein